MGVKLSLDDFGTGWSSLGYLRRFPLDRIKIDRSFVRDIVNDHSTAAIVHSILGLARDLNLDCVAEGVETAEQLEHLRRERCAEIQGYLFNWRNLQHVIGIRYFGEFGLGLGFFECERISHRNL